MQLPFKLNLEKIKTIRPEKKLLYFRKCNFLAPKKINKIFLNFLASKNLLKLFKTLHKTLLRETGCLSTL